MGFTKEQIIEFISDLIIEPRKNAVKWSKVTHQTAILRIGYPGQHLASLVTGVKGEKTGARGNDLADGSEVKSCSRVDQLDKCLSCESPVLRQENKCGSCDSPEIKRNNDSKWLFTVRSDDDLKVLLNLPRIVLIIDDYPNFDKDDFNDIRIQVFEIRPKNNRHQKFSEIMTNYYSKIYLEHKKQNPEKTPAPKNFWPFQYQFYMCNPLLIFSALIKNAYTENPLLELRQWVEPNVNREKVKSVIMFPDILTREEFEGIAKKADRKEIINNLVDETSLDSFYEYLKHDEDLEEIQQLFKGIDEELRKYLDLRDTDRIATAKSKYQRRGAK